MDKEFERMEEEDALDEGSEESMDDAEDGSDSSSDDENEELAERNVVSEINRLQDEISVNQYDYEKHEQLITNLRTLGELDILRECRERMRLLFPLAEPVWLQWLDDEKSLVATDDDKKKFLDLYELALGDFVSPAIWLSYCNYAVEALSLEEMRRVFERAVNTVGSHFTEGRQFWKLFQSMEEAFLKSAKGDQADLQRYIKLFERQFEIPLHGMQEDFGLFLTSIDQFKPQLSSDIPKLSSKAEELFNKSLTISGEFQEHEKKIAHESESLKKSELYKSYIEFVYKKPLIDSSTVVCLYERAITECFNDSSLWIEYLTFCDSKLVLTDLLFPIYERAIRNVPWCSDVWIRYLHSLERLCIDSDAKSVEDCSARTKKIYEKAIASQFSTMEDYKNVCMCYLNHLRRMFTKLNSWNDKSQHENIRKQFQERVDLFLNSFGQENCYELKKFLAKIEAKFLNCQDRAKSIFEELSTNAANFKRYASFWIDYANFQRENGYPDDYKNILLKGLNFCSDYPESIGELLVKYQKEESIDLNELLVVEAKVKAVNKKMAVRRAKEEAQTRTLEPKEEPNDKKILKKRKNEENCDKKASPQNNKKAKKQVEEEKSSTKHGTTIRTDPLKVNQTVFLSNLDFNLEENEIQKEFIKFGDINEVRLVRSFKGASKGYCYVEFKDEMTVHKALLNDRMLLRGRPVFITKMNEKPTLQYSQNAEKNKLFVKNIPLTYTKEDVIEKIFTEFTDSVKEVRLVTYKNGYSKGWAYVEMKDAKAAIDAMEAKNDKEIDGKMLFVAISDPSKSAKSTANFGDKFAGLERGSNPRPKFGAVNFMVPASVRSKTTTQKAKVQPQNTDTSANIPGTSGACNAGGDPIQPLSNDQFRSFLSKK